MRNPPHLITWKLFLGKKRALKRGNGISLGVGYGKYNFNCNTLLGGFGWEDILHIASDYDTVLSVHIMISTCYNFVPIPRSHEMATYSQSLLRFSILFSSLHDSVNGC